MRNLTLALMAGAAMALGAGAVHAQSAWLPMIEREAVVNASVEAGLAAGELTPDEARAIRVEMAALVGLEGRYRLGGLSRWEKLDLDRRFTVVHDRIEIATAPTDAVSLAAFDERRLRLERQLERAERYGDLTTGQAEDLRADLLALDRMEARFRRDGGLTLAERDELEDQLDRLATDFAQASGDGRVYGQSRF